MEVIIYVHALQAILAAQRWVCYDRDSLEPVSFYVLTSGRARQTRCRTTVGAPKLEFNVRAPRQASLGMVQCSIELLRVPGGAGEPAYAAHASRVVARRRTARASVAAARVCAKTDSPLYVRFTGRCVPLAEMSSTTSAAGRIILGALLRPTRRRARNSPGVAERYAVLCIWTHSIQRAVGVYCLYLVRASFWDYCGGAPLSDAVMYLGTSGRCTNVR